MSSQTMEKPGQSRRDFLSKASFITVAIATTGVLAGTLRLIKPNVHYEEPTRFKIGKVENFPEGTSKNLTDKKVFIFSDVNGLFAISSICTHLGCLVSLTEWGFQCPCHGSQYNLDGGVIRGPAPRSLEWHEISQEVDGTLVVDTAKSVASGTKYIFA